MIFALTAIMMAAGSMTMNAQEKVVTLDQLLKKNQEQKQTTKDAQKTTVKAEQKQTQVAQPKAVKQPKTSSAGLASSGYNLFYLQYNAESMRYSKSGFSSSSSCSSISAGFSRGFGISSDLPLYIEAGGALKYIWNKENGVTFSMLSLKVPVNVVYSFAISDAFSIEPYAGFYLRGNLIGKEKYENKGGWDDDWDDWDDDWDDTDWSGSTSVKDEINLFSKDDMGDDAWNRFQFGAQLGVRARINNMFVVGLGYTTDLSNITDNTKFNSFDVTLGITF